jgi:hypothetical protein
MPRSLDEYIAAAHAVLRLARTASSRSRKSGSIRAEVDAEAHLNELLKCKQAAQRR